MQTCAVNDVVVGRVSGSSLPPPMRRSPTGTSLHATNSESLSFPCFSATKKKTWLYLSFLDGKLQLLLLPEDDDEVCRDMLGADESLRSLSMDRFSGEGERCGKR